MQLSGFIFLLISPATIAGTVVEIQNNNALTTVFTDGQQARINMPGSDYVIVDYKNQSVKMVSPEKQQVTVLNSKTMTTANNSVPGIRTSIDKLGNGHLVAGYKTQKFGYKANGKPCAVIYGSSDAYQAKGMKELFAAMKIMMQQQQAMLGGFAALVDDCTLADMKISDHVNTIGVPMRTEKNGKVDTEIKSIRVDVVLPVDAFAIPESYKAVSVQDQISGMLKAVPAKPRMQQYQQPAQIPPQAMEQMRRAQQMMQRYPQR